MKKMEVIVLLVLLTICFHNKSEGKSTVERNISIKFFGRLQVPFREVSLEQKSQKCLLKIDQKIINNKMNVCHSFFKKNRTILENNPPIPDIVIPTVMYGEVSIKDKASRTSWKRIIKIINHSVCNSNGKCKKANITPVRKATFDLIDLATKEKQS